MEWNMNGIREKKEIAAKKMIIMEIIFLPINYCRLVRGDNSPSLILIPCCWGDVVKDHVPHARFVYISR